MRGTSASDRRSTSLSSYLAALALATLMAVWLCPSPAHAQSGPADRRAFELFQQGDELYKQGKFAEAAEKFRSAYAIDPNPTLLYNLARSYENLGELEQAAATYREFVERQPDAPDRGAIERRIETLDEQIEERAALKRVAEERERRARRQAPEETPQAEPEPEGAGVMPWVMIGVGGAAVLAGGVVRFMAEQKRSDAEEDPVARSAVDKNDDAQSLATASTVALIAGGVIAAGGVTWLVVGGGSKPRQGSASLGVTAGLGTIAIGGRF